MEQRDEYGRVLGAEPVLAPALAKAMGHTSFPVAQTCRHCGQEIEDRADPGHDPHWVHIWGWSGGMRHCAAWLSSADPKDEDA